jgi:hypothetical protein
MTGRRRWTGALAAVAMVVVLQSCSTSGLAFVQDNRISIATPRTNQEVKLPFDVTWSAKNYAGSYGVFIDGSPMRPGQSLLSLVPSDDPCRNDAQCPDPTWLAQHDVYVTKDPTVTVKLLADKRGKSSGRDTHQLTIVLLDEQGRRLGESSFIKEFAVDRSKKR